jgi:hypothetical protein
MLLEIAGFLSSVAFTMASKATSGKATCGKATCGKATCSKTIGGTLGMGRRMVRIHDI